MTYPRPELVPYFRRTNETSAAWAAFVIYRNLNNERSVAKVAGELGLTTQALYKWTKKYEWEKRVLIYDRENEAAKRKAELAEIEEMRARHIAAARVKQNIGEIELAKVQKAATTNKEALVIQPSLASKLQSEGMTEERLSRGEPGEITQTVDDSEISLKGLQVHEIEILRAMYVKLKKTDSGKELAEHVDDIDGDDETEPIDI